MGMCIANTWNAQGGISVHPWRLQTAWWSACYIWHKYFVALHDNEFHKIYAPHDRNNSFLQVNVDSPV